MNVNRVLEVRNGDTVNTFRGFLASWWDQYRPDALLAPVEQKDQRRLVVKVIEDPAEISSANPFAPVMSGNSASRADQMIQERLGGRLAVILRPCELRAFIELQKRRGSAARQSSVVVIGVDCLGTFSKADYKRYVEARGADEVTYEVLRNAAEGGLRPQHFRIACQICDWPAPRGADITIGTMGIASDKQLLLIARDEKVDAGLKLGAVAGDLASEYQISHRETIVGAIADTHAGVRQSMVEDMKGTSRFDDLGSILAWFANCSQCGECLRACPLYEGEFSELINRHGVVQPGRTPLGEVISLSRWLASCAGCGMCEEECNMHVPLFLLISALSHRIRDKMHYYSGDPAQQLPWISF